VKRWILEQWLLSKGEDMATLGDLVRGAAATVSKHGSRNWGYSKALAKEFGEIFYNNKTCIYDPESHILEIRMVMGAKTDSTGIDYHAVRIALLGVQGRVYNSLADLYMDRVFSAEPDRDDFDEKKAREHIEIIKAEKGSSVSRNTRRRNFLPTDKENVSNLDIDLGGALHQQLSGFIIPCAHQNEDSAADFYADDNKVFYFEEPLSLDLEARVSCSCSDYFWTFAFPNDGRKAHLGDSPVAYKKANPEYVRNVHQSIGMCKHLMLLTVLLLNGGIIDRTTVDDFAQMRRVLVERRQTLRVRKRLIDTRSRIKTMADMQRAIQDITHIRATTDNSRIHYIYTPTIGRNRADEWY
jgi:hypothetical protein